MTLIAHASSTRGEVALKRRDDGVLELRVNGVFVMDTVETASERALARVALDAVAAPARVLVGGLGLGFTTAELLTDDRVASVTVVEIEEAVVGWLRDGLVPHGPGVLADERVAVVVGDVLDHLSRAAAASYDVVLLDVDNGPGQLVHLPNAALYERIGITVANRVLAPGGALVVWSAHPARALATELRATVGRVSEHRVPVSLGDRETEYWVYAARR